jgi:photosystem II stability/assembly factor-like uncharacterized protein
MKRMKYQNIIFLLVIFLNLSHLQSQWSDISISPLLNVTSVDFLDNGSIFVVQDNTIFKSSNEGESWIFNYSGVSGSSLEYLETYGTILIAVGKDFLNNKSVILRSADGGDNWASIPIDSDSYLKTIELVDDSSFFIAGSDGRIFKSIDLGNTWIEKNSNTSTNIQSLSFINANTGFAVGGTSSESLILKTIDGGENWIEKNIDMDNNLQSIHMISEFLGYTVGWNGLVAKTLDCGENWNFQNSINMNGNLDIKFLNTNTEIGFIVGGEFDRSSIQKTTDGGENWEEVGPELDNGLIRLNITSDDYVYAVGRFGLILKSTNPTSIVLNKDYDSKINLYPNPTFGVLNINCYSAIDFILIKDSFGRVVSYNEGVNSDIATLDLSSYFSGIYFVTFFFNGKSITKKIIKK